MTTPNAVHVKVATEVGYCPFCRRSRNLRREERQLGGLVRTNIECESCHRTLSSTIGPPAPQAVEEEKPEERSEPAPEAEAAAPKRAPRKAAAKKPAAKKPAARKPSSTRKTRA